MTRLVIPEETPLYATFERLAQTCDLVFFAGLPGVGKSLFLQQLALMAQQQGRSVHLLQWDVTRDAFETPEILRKYPEIDGVTHAVIRKAVGLWTRSAVLQWYETYGQQDHILIGEVPLVGHRLMELVKPHNDEAESLLTHSRTQFVIPVPSASVRQMIEAKREQTIADPQHEKEAKDAPPNVLHGLWRDLYQLAFDLGMVDYMSDSAPYMPQVYRMVYEHLLKHRNTIALLIDTVLEASGSVYDLDNIAGELQATPEQVEAIMSTLEREYTIAQIQEDVEQWYVV